MPVESAVKVDYLVIGAGIAGASVAGFLSQGARIAVLDMESHAGYHSTGRSAAVFTEHYGSRPVRALTRASRSFLFDPPAGFARAPLVSPRAGLYVARHDQLDTLREFQGDPDVAKRARELTVTEVVDQVPILRPDYVAAGLLEESSADLDVNEIHQGFLRMLRARQSTLYTDHGVIELARQGQSWVARTRRGSFEAPVVVNAAGAWGDDVAKAAGVNPIGLQALRRTAVLIPVPNGLDARHWPAVIDISETFYFKPDAGLLLLSPADETPSPPCDAQPEELDVAVAVDRFETATGTLVTQARRRWAGLRVFSPDRTPVVGFDAQAPGFFWLVGQGGYGIQTCPAIARLAAALLQGLPVPSEIQEHGVNLSELDPSRFSREIVKT